MEKAGSDRKGAGDENFPVASILIDARLRPHVRAFYDFARAADDIADDPVFSSEEKLERLDTMAVALDDGGAGNALAASIAETGIGRRHAHDLLVAFRRDAAQSRYADWTALIDYCRFSAAPCGRFLLDLHGPSAESTRKAADALSAALQVINHIQDCGADYRILNRVYVPLDWLASEGGVVEDLGRDYASPGLRRTLDRMLDGVDCLIDEARPLPGEIAALRLALEAGIVLDIARRLSQKLRRQDPLDRPVRLSRVEYAASSLMGVARTLGARLLKRNF